MKVAIAGFLLESASLMPVLSTVEDFERTATRGDEIFRRYRGTNTVVGGFIEVCEREGLEMTGIVYTEGGAAGSASDAAFDRYTSEICAGLAGLAGKIDGLLLHLHGAMVTESRVDPDLDILKAVRDVVGADLPVIVALDYHGNLDEGILAQATALFGYHKSPHVDMGHTGERAAHCMARVLKDQIQPVARLAKPGVMVPSIFSATDLTPLRDILAEARRMESEAGGYLDISVFGGFSYADVPNCGFSVVAVSDRDPALAEQAVATLTRRLRAQRHALYQPIPVYGLEEGVALALKKARTAGKPIVLLEHADRMNDSTYGLRELMRQGARNAAVPYLHDPVAAKAAVEAGEGARVKLEAGGRSSPEAGGPVTVEGVVRFAGEKEYKVTGPMGNGSLVQLGPTAVLELDGIVLWLVSHPRTAIDEDPFTQFGMRAQDFDVILLRSKTHFRAVYEPLAEEILIIDTPDWGPANLTAIPYRHVPRERTYPFTDA
jgi:microcystin degradation protein MlrC